MELNNELNMEQKQRRKLEPKEDVVFKRLFGSLGSEKIMKSLLESILETEISDVELDLRQEYLPEDVEEGRKNILDVRVTFNDGTQAYIEMQRDYKKNIDKRSLFYWARAYAAQAKKGDEELESLHKTIGIWIFDEGIYFPQSEKYHHVLKMVTQEGIQSELFDDMEIHFFELQKLRHSDIMSPRKIDFWMWFIDHTNEEMVQMAERSVEEIREAVKKLRELEADPVVSEIAFKELLAEMDYNQAIRDAEKEGIEKGLEEGMEKGMKEGIEKGMKAGMEEGMEKGMKKGMEKGMKEGMEKGIEEGVRKTAQKMKEKGMPYEIIAELTGLNTEDIEKL